MLVFHQFGHETVPAFWKFENGLENALWAGEWKKNQNADCNAGNLIDIRWFTLAK